jgi:hypothetical protein
MLWARGEGSMAKCIQLNRAGYADRDKAQSPPRRPLVGPLLRTWLLRSPLPTLPGLCSVKGRRSRPLNQGSVHRG